MSLLRQIKFAEGLLLRVAVPREKDLQGKPAILSTRQHFHALPQQIQGQLHRSPCCKKGTTKIPVHRVRPKTFKASNSCLSPHLIKQLLKKINKDSMLLETVFVFFK